MIHKPIEIKNLQLSFPHKTCFDDFTVQVPYGCRIAIIGRNGCGKTTLLKILNGMVEPTSGDIGCTDDVVFGFVPQIIEDNDALSGGQRLNEAVTQALNLDPNDVVAENVKKLEARYPGGHFDVYHSENRKEGDL